jgi:hypothetical protein
VILQSIVQTPRLYSGVDQQGRGWTTLFLPRRFSEALSEMTERQRVATLRGLYAEVRASGG